MSGATLARRTLGRGSLFVFAVGASSPLTVLIGGVVATFALTGVEGVPLSFLVIMVLLAVGPARGRLRRHGQTRGAQRPVLRSARSRVQPGHRSGRRGGGAAHTIQISLFALIGTTMAGLYGAGSWWAWAAGAWVVVAVLGRFRGAANAKVLGTLLAVELATILLFDIAAFAHPAGGSISVAPLMPSNLMVSGAAGALAFAMAAFTGVESPQAFGEEARSAKVVSGATFGGIAFLGVFYALSSWAYATAVGPGKVVEAARDPDRGPFSVLGSMFGPGIILLATLLLIAAGGACAGLAAWGDLSVTALAYPLYVAVSMGAVAVLTLRPAPAASPAAAARPPESSLTESPAHS